jgi:TPR repeat protein
MRGAPVVVALLAGLALAGEPQSDVEALRKICDGKPADPKPDNSKQAKACTALALRQFAASAITAADERRAVEWLERGCQGGDGAGCALLGSTLFRGRGAVAPDYARAFRASRRGCELGDDNACYDQACALVAARGVEKNSLLAASMFERLCRKNFAQACGSLGMLYYVGDGVKHDPKHATELLDQACKGGDTRSCPRD